MGASRSKEPKPKCCNHSPLPQDTSIYGGPSQLYLFCHVEVQITSDRTFGLSASHSVQSNIDSYYPMLMQYYQQGYLLNTFCRVSHAGQVSGIGSVVVPYEAIFCKPADGSLPEEGIPYELKVEKSLMQIQAITTGIITPGTVANTADIIQKIAQYSSQGARLIGIVMTGHVSSRGFQNAIHGSSGDIGVDVFFNLPCIPNPPLYSYQVVNVPIQFTAQPGSAGSVTAECDFMGHFAGYLNQGWKLVEIFRDYAMQKNGAFSMSGQMNSIWLFEKDTSRINDPTPIYEGTIINYEHVITAKFGGVKLKSDWSPVMQQMGEKGWELACLLETPQQQRTGFVSVSIAVLLFFQRKIIHKG